MNKEPGCRIVNLSHMHSIGNGISNSVFMASFRGNLSLDHSHPPSRKLHNNHGLRRLDGMDEGDNVSSKINK